MKNLVKKTMAIAAAALCLGAGLQAFGSSGDVWSIVQCDESGTWTNRFDSTVTTNSNGGVEVSNPIPVKEALYFRLRLWNHRAADSTGTPYYLPWKPTYSDERLATTNETEQAADWESSKPRIGIFSAGSDIPKFAELVNVDNTSNTNFTDLVFKYVVQAGDFGFPIDIALKGSDGPVPSYTGSGSTYYFDPTRTAWTFKPWDYKNSAFVDEEVVWAGGDYTSDANILAPEYPNYTNNDDGSKGRGIGGTGTSFSYETKFYVQTVRYGATDSEGSVTTDVGEYSISMGGTKTVGLLVADEALSEAQRFYLWSDNEDAFTVAASTGVTVAQDVVVGKDDSDADIVRDVATVTLTGTTASFALTGVDTNKTANLVLSATPHYNRMIGGALARDFVTIPVAVTEPDPASLAVTGPTTITATGDRWTGTRVNVALTLPLPADAEYDIPVTLVPSVENGDWKDYVFFATTETREGATPPTYTDEQLTSLLSGVIKKGTRQMAYSSDNATVKELYVYALRSDAQSTVLTITPQYDTTKDTANFIGGRTTEYSPYVKSAVSVTTPDTSAFVPTKNVPYAISVGVADAYADEQSAAAYTLKIKTDASADDSSAATYTVYLRNGVLYTDPDTLALPEVTYKTELAENTTAVKVVSPVGQADSGWVTFTHSVKKLDVEYKITAEDGTTSSSATIAEGKTLTGAVTNQAYNDGPLWAFLVANEEPNAVDCNWFTNSSWVVGTNYTDGVGLRIEPGATSTTLAVTPVTPMTVTFNVVLCTTPTYDPANIYQPFPSTTFSLTVTNTAAEATDMWMYMNRDLSEQPEDRDEDGDGSFSESVLYGQQRSFRAFVSDVAYDKENGMVVKWTVRKVGATKDERVPFIDENGNETTNSVYYQVSTGADNTVDTANGLFSVKFLAATNYYVTAEVWDKYDYPGQNNETYSRGSIVQKLVKVTGLSTVNVTTSFSNGDGDNILYENTTSTPRITVGLGDWTDEAEVMVELTVKPKSDTEKALGTLLFASDEPYSVDEDTNTYVYRKTFSVGSYEPWVLEVDTDTLDGVANSASGTKGWDISAEVITTDVLASKGMAANEYYKEGGLARAVKVINVSPEPDTSLMPVDAETSTYTNLSKEATIEWGVVETEVDLSAFWTNTTFGAVKTDADGNYPAGTGVVIVVRGENVQTTAIFSNGATYGQIEPTFVDEQSAATVYIDFYDKDQAKSKMTAGPYIYPVQAAKMLTTVANMPSGGNALIKLSTKYANAKGVGYGHTWVSGGDKKFVNAENFYLHWNCGISSSSVMIYAFGYETDAIDDGNLDTIDGQKYDIWLNPRGNHARNADTPTSQAGFYQCVDGMYDSFFYGWITATEPGGTEYQFGLNPALGTNNVLRTAQIKLPTSAAEDGSYETTYAEAVFSREHNQYDQMGDINDDGIPDYYASAFTSWSSGAPLSEADGEGGELAAINGLNDDNDYYPGNSATGTSSISPGAVSGWATSGQPFNAYREIRGYHEGLNFGMFKFNRDERVTYGWISDLNLRDLEKRSLLNHAIQRRNALVKKLYTTGHLDVSSMNDEYQEYDLITNMLSQIYYKGMAPGASLIMPDDDTNGDNRLFYPDASYVNSHLTNDIDRIVIDIDTGTNMTVLADAWLRTYKTAGATDWSLITNYVGLVAYTNNTDEANPIETYLQPWELYTVDDADIGNWLDKEYNAEKYASQQATAKAYIDYTWRHFVSSGIWGWTCENRTDPTTDDTDGDGMSDGYEYYMWYAAVVGAGNEQLHGCKFNLGDLEDYTTEIAPADIASIYNPNVANNWTGRDTDNDGLYDQEEFLIGTSPVHWDTDRDGLSDLYEVTYNINPLSTQPGQNGGANGDGDFMAFCKIPASDPLGAYEYAYVATDGTYWLLDRKYAGYVSPYKESMTIPAEGEAAVHGIRVVPFNGGYTLPTENTANYTARVGNVREFTEAAPLEFSPTKTLALHPKNNNIRQDTVSLYHHQVYNYFGFDPRTGWSVQSNGTVSPTDRWIENGSPIPGGIPQNTTAYTAINEYLLLKYRYSVGLRDLAKDLDDLKNNKTTIANVVIDGTTNPSANFDSRTWGDSTTTYAQAQHGADTDGDGVPDGWELYIGVSPNRKWTIVRGQPGYDPLYWDGSAIWPIPIADGAEYDDGLGLGGEYAGTDPCGVYSACASIYANHPSQEGGLAYRWFNKLMPTDPRNPDTDGDTIADGAEGSVSWGEEFTFGRWGQSVSDTRTVKHFGIYGNNSDGGSRCVRGGGLNPCTIDTDEDGLPDPWERQYAGILFKGNRVALSTDGYEVFAHDNVPTDALYDNFKAAVRAYGEVDDDDFLHVLMGMDPTVADATTDPSTGVADLDWDGDGLQNWQEYMVQAMRHLRYDDPRTPLLGRDCPAFSSSGKLEQGRFNGEDSGFLRVSYTTPYTAEEAKEGGVLETAGYPNFAKFVRLHPDYLAILGYFTDPPAAWDHALIDRANKYMLPPSRITDTELEIGYSVQATNENGVAIWQYQGSELLYTGTVMTANGCSYAPYTMMNGEDEVVMDVVVDPVMTTATIAAGSTIILRPAVGWDLNYVGTDPRLWDTDGDGMDDYYELFHGLNPLLGSVGSFTGDTSKDVIARNSLVISGGHRISAWNNSWVGWNNDVAPAYDPMKYPWMMGTLECDADGDGLSNYEESLLANVASPSNSHTDPTPLWMTDATVPTTVFATTNVVSVTNYYANAAGEPIYKFENGQLVRTYSNIVTRVVTNATAAVCANPSYTALYYPCEIRPVAVLTLEAGGSVTTNGLINLAESWKAYQAYITSFEQTEGYDSDNDFRTDSSEVKSLSRKNSDPLDFNDPAHRQSVWFGGNDEPGAAISYETTYRNANGADFFKQFTVEAWIKPDEAANGQDQYIVSRASYYAPWDLYSWEEYVAASNAFVRMNFALGIDAAGNIFAEYENATELKSRVTGEKAVDGKWTHVAATYDGSQLKLYRDGALDASADTTLIPANGVLFLMQNPPALTHFPVDTYRVVPSTTILGARAIGPGAFGYVDATTALSWDDVAADFYKGRVAEVRTWDGARTAAQIKEAYNKSFSVDDVKQMRLEAYAAWRDGAVRNDNSGRTVAPAELVQYYNMATLPGATEASYVRTEPGGFVTNVLSVVRNPETGKPIDTDVLKVGWWSALQNSPLANTVYTSEHVVTWMENMVSHLPKLSGAIEDSVFWNENYAGYTLAGFQNLDEFTIPYALNPYNSAVHYNEDTYLYNKLFKLGDGDVNTGLTTNTTLSASHLLMYVFDSRMSFNGVTDLIPLGSAYAKRSADYWDGEGAETAWQETGADENANDLPDWWEKIYGLASDATGDTEVERNGVRMAASEAYIRDLAAGMLPTKKIDEAYANREDFDKNGLADWWTDIYGVKGAAADDDDNDGLSNFTEFLLSEYFDLGVSFSPVKAKSVSIYDSDYFFKIGQLYAGEIFTDHDFVEDVWEDAQGEEYANRYAWDSGKDYDEDGWSNWAERRYSQFTTSILAPTISHIAVDDERKDMPIPTLKVTLRYNGDQPLVAAATEGGAAASGGGESAEYDNQLANAVGNIVVQTFTKSGLVVPDATFTLLPGVDALRYVELGSVSGELRQGNLAPGYVKAGDVELLVLQEANSRVYQWSIYGIRVRKGTYEMYLADVYKYGQINVALLQYEATWIPLEGFSVVKSGNSSQATLALNGATIGTIDVVTGEFTLDTSKLSGAVDTEGNTVDIDVAQFRFNYISRVPTLQSNNLKLYLGEPNTGYVKEGENTIVAFVDLDGDGKYTNGEPMGTTVADVGWRQGVAEIELTDTSAIITRADLLAGSSDRAALYGTESGDTTDLIPGTLSGGKYERVRVVRTAVNGSGIDKLSLSNQVIFDKVINLDQRSYFYEGDVLENGDFDIDWSTFNEITYNANMATGGGSIDPLEVTYRIVMGNGTIATTATNNLFSIATIRHFDSASARTRPVAQAPGSQASAVFGSRPVFKWTMKSVNPDTGDEWDNNSYTAFRVQVLDGSTVVYDSGVRRAPARDLNGVYTFVPDVYAGDILEPSKNYKWRVSMYNSKFQTNYWSEDGANTFRMNALTNSLGTIKVAVRYFGPSSVLSAGAVRVEAFETPDFTGDPVARTFVGTKSSVAVSDSEHVANATLIGLAPGKYYVRGYVDLSAYGDGRKKDSWESWGYVSKRDGADSDIFTPQTIVIDDTLGQGDTFDLYIEDVDTNGNCLPDAWEMVRNGGSLDNGTQNLNDTLNSGVEINQNLSGNLQNQQNGSPAVSGLAAYVFSVMSNSGVAALVLDADTSTHSSYTLAAADAAGTLSTVATPQDVEVTAIGTDETSVTLAIKGSATVKTTATKGGKTLMGAGSTIYTTSETSAESEEDAKLEGVVEYVKSLENLTEDAWKSTGKTVSITVNPDGSFEVEPFSVPKPAGANEQCFFRILLKN